MKFYVVGSALSKETPRDVDMYGVMDDELFEHVFGMDAERFQYWRRLEHKAPPNTYISPNFIKWQNQVAGATRVLQFVFPQLVPLDFKIVPRSLLHKPHIGYHILRVDLTSAPESWGIGFPNLETHVDVVE